VTAPGNRLGLLDQDGTLTATRNWLKTGWVASHSGGSVSVVDAGQVTGADPGFADFADSNYAPAAASPCVDQAVALAPACLPDYWPMLEYVRHQQSRPRADDGQPDLGAFEYAPPVGVPDATSAGQFRTLVATPNPFSTLCHVRLEGAGPALGQPGALEVLDARGRAVVRLPSSGMGRWDWTPSRALPGGVYFLRLGPRVERVTLVR
jgi:hypothetical protein